MPFPSNDGVGYSAPPTQAHTYEDMPGLVVSPSANREGAARLLRVHGRAALRRVSWSASRSGAPPVLPIPENTARDTLIAATVTAAAPQPNMQTMQYMFAASGTYVYLQNEPRIVGLDPLPTGGQPYAIPDLDFVAATRYASEIKAASTAPNPEEALVIAAAARFSGSSVEGWYLTGYPAQTFTTQITG